MKQSPIFVRTYDFLRWLIPATVKFPRQQRFVLAAALQRSGLAFQERLIEAALRPQPESSLGEADVELTKLRFYLRLSHDLELLGEKQYAHAAGLVDEMGRLLGAWKDSLGKRVGAGRGARP